MTPAGFIFKYGTGNRSMEYAIKAEDRFGPAIFNYHESACRLAQKLHFAFDPLYVTYARTPALISRSLLAIASREIAVRYKMPVSGELKIEGRIQPLIVPERDYPPTESNIEWPDPPADRKPEDLRRIYATGSEKTYALLNRAIRNEIVGGDNALDALKFAVEIHLGTKGVRGDEILHDIIGEALPGLQGVVMEFRTRIQWRYQVSQKEAAK